MKRWTDDEIIQLNYDWNFWGRPNQLFPADDWWRIWLILAGRGFGKTRTGAESVKFVVQKNLYHHIGLIAPIAADARDVMVEGESGIMNVFPPHSKPIYEPSKRKLTFPNGAVAHTYSADDPERMRGHQFEFLWMDELASWKYPETYDMAMFGLRLGINPRCLITTTPKPTKLIKALINDSHVLLTKGSTYDNKSNLAPPFLQQIIEKYEGTRLGRQELNAEILEDVEGAMWHRDLLDATRIQKIDCPEFTRIVIGVDPAVSNKKTSNETGIVVAGLAPNQESFILDDLSMKGTPNEWATAVVDAFHRWEADCIVPEANNGGDLVAHTIKTIDPTVTIKMVHASRGKQTRAEPVSSLYEQNRVHHVGVFPVLEDQMTTWVPSENSPDRMDALVWAVTELMLGKQKKKIRNIDLHGLGKTSTWKF